MRKQKTAAAIILICTVLACIFFWQYSMHVEKTPLTSTEGRSFQKAQVVEVLSDAGGDSQTYAGIQRIRVRMLTGDLAGQILEATSADGNLFGAVCRVGMRVVVIVSTTDSGSLISVYSQDREQQNYSFIAIFCLLICVIGGRNGVKSVIGLAFTCMTLFFLYLPMIYQGVSPFAAAVFAATLTTMVSMYFIGGFSRKTLSAIIGTVAGVWIAGMASYLYGLAAGISGYNVSNIETLLFVGQNTNIQIGGLLFSGILISALGAVMDVAMSISSTVCELKRKNPDASWRELFVSGMHVGRDMMGTMSNTLILAFIGGSLSTLLMNYAYDLPYLQVINSYSIGIEIMQGVSGSIGVVMTVPCVSLVSALLFGKDFT